MVDLSDETTAQAMRTRIGDGLSAACAESGQMVTRWIAMIEVIDADGERSLWSLSDEDSRPWDALGLLSYGISLEHAAINADQANL